MCILCSAVYRLFVWGILILFIGSRLNHASSVITKIYHRELLNCALKRNVIIEESNGQSEYSFRHNVHRHFKRLSLPFSLYETNNTMDDDKLREIIRDNSDNALVRPTMFLLMTPQHLDILTMAEIFFQKELKRRGSVFPHTSRWIILMSNCIHIKQFSNWQAYSILDNVAVFCIDSLQVDMFTLIWRENRRRELQKVQSNTETTTQCNLFPNVRNGLNGRNLLITTLPHGFYYVNVRYNPKPEYYGTLVDVTQIIADVMNFTFTFSPGADEKPTTWDEIAMNVSRGDVDFACSVWCYNWMDYYNFSFTSPLITDRITGAYRRQYKPGRSWLFVVFPFPPMTYVVVAAAMLFTVFVYVFLVCLVYPQEGGVVPCLRETGRSPQRQDILIGEKHTGASVFIKNLWDLIATLLTQFYLPRPKQLSAKLLIFFWALTIVIYNATYSGSLTAGFVTPKYKPPIQTFEQMVQQDDYQWGIIANLLTKRMSNTNNGLLKKILTSDKGVKYDDLGENDMYQTVRAALLNMDDKFILLSFESVLKMAMYMDGQPQDYFFMQDTIMSMGEAFIVPPGSEIGDMMSKVIGHIVDSGIFRHIDDSYQRTASQTPQHGTSDDVKVKTMFLEDYKFLFVIMSGMLLTAVVILLAEIFYDRKRHCKNA